MDEVGHGWQSWRDGVLARQLCHMLRFFEHMSGGQDMRGLALASMLFLLCSNSAGAADLSAPPKSGIDSADLDTRVRPQDDFYTYAVGGWIQRVHGPAYMPGWSANRELQLRVYEELDKDIRQLAQNRGADANQRKLADFYASYMDIAHIDAAGLQPLTSWLKSFDQAAAPRDVVRAIAMLSAHGLDLGLGTWIHPDDQDPTHYIADFVQSDLALPERDYYLSDEPRFTKMREAYRGHVERILALAGSKHAADEARGIVSLETQLARAQWTEVAKRVPGATTHRQTRAQLSTATPGLDLALFADGIGIPADTVRYNLSEPDYFATYGKLLNNVPLPTWRAYLRFRLLDHLARFLPAPYRDEADRFYTMTLQGATAARPRWLRAMGVLEDAMGDALGQLYVQRHFPPEARAQAMHVLDNVAAAFRQRIRAADWLSETSKQGALAKLDQLVIRMGAPDRIKDYSSLATRADDPIGNWLRARALLWQFEVDKLGRPVDREEWTMSPQSVNGYYSVSRNQVVLPAALLQPPYFQMDADDAVNYGGLGFFIAHELTHAFDRAGSQYDGLGKRVEWMSATDRGEFERRTRALIAQYSGYELASGFRLDGELTIGENIADNSGLAIAYDAYQLARGNHPASVLDGFTGDQRFFLSFARIWAEEPVATPAGITRALADTHAPDHYRVIGAVANQEAFYRAFKVKQGDRMFLPAAKRTRLW
ncbi:M13 family metallopeptidase [Dyella sp. LX-66]|uniref:M13 family metallopeptidase n=1 Tax=unclassified Dyella TaxID=2634549 RepID=UPI001BE02DB6|nr:MULTISPECIES: M13 family metallopeptidase [unclassified Dyella]MBT2118384.1 M13 family metallopeptidase [Dyella sp. LX-1]MBT2140267.1 M13 family metallopeptidase [Dyella sp. LX-66]